MSHQHHGPIQPAQPTDTQLNQQLQGEAGAYNQFQGAQDAAQQTDQVRAAMDGIFGNAFAELADEVRLMADKAPVATGGGAGYRFSPEQIEQQLAQCDSLIEGLRNEDLRQAERVAKCTSPAADTVASVPQAKAVATMGQRLVQRIQNQITFVQNWQTQLRTVRQNYLDQEGHTEATWKAMTGGLYEEQQKS